MPPMVESSQLWLLHLPPTTTTGNSNLRPRSSSSTRLRTSRQTQKLLDDFIEKSLVMEKDAAVFPDNHLSENGDCGIRLFRNAPPGIVFDKTDELQGPTKKPRILPGIGIDEKSKKFKKLLQTIAVDGEDILAAAREANRKSLTRLEARDAAAKAKAKHEEERVAELKRVRGERWLPSIAREMQKYGVTKIDDLL